MMHTQHIHLTILCVFCENVILFMKVNNGWGNAHTVVSRLSTQLEPTRFVRT
jgi:hypothetical protein